jgi:hypothetical protein
LNECGEQGKKNLVVTEAILIKMLFCSGKTENFRVTNENKRSKVLNHPAYGPCKEFIMRHIYLCDIVMSE